MVIPMKVKIKVIKNTIDLGTPSKRVRRAAIKSGGQELLEAIQSKASGGRRPIKGYHPYRAANGPSKGERINKQNGDFLSSIKGRLPKEPVSWGPFYYFVESSGVEYASYLTKGTKIMYGRDIFREAMQDSSTRKRVYAAALKSAKKALK